MNWWVEEQLKLQDGILADAGTIFEPDVYGAVVNIGSYIQGLPDNMYNLREEREYALPTKTIYANLGYNAGNSGKKAMNFCKNIISKVNKYQASHNVKLIGVFYTKQNGTMFMIEVIIKDFDERFVINNVAFAFHPSFFRRLFFSHLEAEKFIDTYGYGQSQQGDKVADKIKTFHKKTEEAILLPSLNSLSESADFEDRQIVTIQK